MKSKTIMHIIMVITILAICCSFVIVDAGAKPQTYVWFEDLATIEGVDATSGQMLTNGEYDITLIDGSEMSIVVENGVWYFD